MIHFMPFTFIPAPLLDRLHAIFGAVAVCQPLADLLPGNMRKAADDGWLRLCPPHDIDQKQLRQSLRAFTDWAAVHGGRAGDLTGFFRSRQLHRDGHGAGQGEADAHQIHAQLRRRTDGVPPKTDDPLFEAALFLCLAHNYDQQQETLNMDLGKVQALEENFGRILGEPDAASPPIGPTLTDDAASDAGAHMTRHRLASWARVVLSHADAESCFVTTSAAVMEDIRECWPAIEPVVRIPISGGNAGDSQAAETLRRDLVALIGAENPGAAAATLSIGGAAEASGPCLVVNVVQGCAPRDFILKYIDKKQDDIERVAGAQPPCNTLIGHFAF